MPGSEKVLEGVTLRAHACRFAGRTKVLTLPLMGSLASNLSQVEGMLSSQNTATWLVPRAKCSFAPHALYSLGHFVRYLSASKVEMESLAAASAAALCIYDMCKPISKGTLLR